MCEPCKLMTVVVVIQREIRTGLEKTITDLEANLNVRDSHIDKKNWHIGELEHKIRKSAK